MSIIASSAEETQTALPLRKAIRCINCWARFQPEEVLWISDGRENFGDPLLGPEFGPRFSTLRFSVEGDGIDGFDARCPDMACPRCHLSIPRDLLTLQPFFVSILGAPACGKSFFLASMTWKLRRSLAQMFALDFTDADRVSNQGLSDYERAVFMSNRPDEPTCVSQLIPKTELQGQLYNSIRQRGQNVLLPRPLSFRISATRHHPYFQHPKFRSRLVCLYDNAGEHFLPGFDSAAAPGTRHLAVSDLFLFLYDPLQDPRFVHALGDDQLKRQAEKFEHAVPQEQILRECFERSQRHSVQERSASRPPKLMVIVTKLDEFQHSVSGLDAALPFLPAEDPHRPRRLNLQRLHRTSEQLKNLLQACVPEIVHTAEMVSRDPVFVTASALGNRPVPDATGRAMLKPSQIDPQMVELPLVYGLAERAQGLIPTTRRSQGAR